MSLTPANTGIQYLLGLIKRLLINNKILFSKQILSLLTASTNYIMFLLELRRLPMNGFIFKTMASAFFSIILIPALACATSTVNNKNKLGASVGCMSCHQSETLQAVQSSQKKQAALHQRKQTQKS